MRCTIRTASSAAACTIIFLHFINLSKPFSSSQEIIVINTQDFHNGILNGSFDVIVDVRTIGEWSEGHIPNATFLESLADFGSSSEKSNPESLKGCESCRIVVYCRSGARAGRAAQRLVEEAGFLRPIYNGLGVNQWTEAGFLLVSDGESVVPPCVREQNVGTAGQSSVCCRATVGGDVEDNDGKRGVETCGGDSLGADALANRNVSIDDPPFSVLDGNSSVDGGNTELTEKKDAVNESLPFRATGTSETINSATPTRTSDKPTFHVFAASLLFIIFSVWLT